MEEASEDAGEQEQPSAGEPAGMHEDMIEHQ